MSIGAVELNVGDSPVTFLRLDLNRYFYVWLSRGFNRERDRSNKEGEDFPPSLKKHQFFSALSWLGCRLQEGKHSR